MRETPASSGDGLSLHILKAAFDGASQAEDFARKLGVAPEEVAVCLDALVDAGFLETSGGKHPRYALVDRGECYRNVLSARACATGRKS